jgi:MoxR-like ATPase
MDAKELVTSWVRGRATAGADHTLELAPRPGALAEKVRAAYHWVVTDCIHCPYNDVEFGRPVTLGEGGQVVHLSRQESYASFVLLPLLTLLTSRRMVFVGAPGRGKTSVAVLMALLAGLSPEEARRGVQHGHPQLSIADLLGSPLPSDLIKADDARNIKVSWRRWVSSRVKVIDEYNRIPTKTQSALLSLMAEGYAEMFEQVVYSGRSAWFLTANDDLGGGTFPVIEALKDRIDLVVRCTPFHAQFLRKLEERVAAPTTLLPPAEVVFTAEELDDAHEEVRSVAAPADVLEVLGYLLGQLDFCGRASPRLEFKNKDTLHLAGRRVGHVCTEDCPLDKQENLCSQTENGVSARTYESLLHYAKALAYFRGNDTVSVEDVRELLPWVLHDKLRPNPQGAFFQKPQHHALLVDRVSWIRQLFDRAAAQHAARRGERAPVLEHQRHVEAGLTSVSPVDLRNRLGGVERRIDEILRKSELNGAVYEDLLLLKRIHGAYVGELARREQRPTS